MSQHTVLYTFISLALMLAPVARPGLTWAQSQAPTSASQGTTMTEKIVKTEDEWRQLLTPEEYRILRKKGTEPAFSSPLNNNKSKGVYRCAACGLELFSSDAKIDSGTGWPSFWQPLTPHRVATKADNSFFMKRTEVLCPRCGSHLGHVFDDGPPPTGLRYCMNGLALKFKAGEEEQGK
jgi:peptide-methionine (R)-S-oxide reductase